MPSRFRPRLVALETRDTPAALLQVVNASPYPGAAALDIFINGLLVPELTGLGYQKATPFLTEPSAVPLTVSVRPAGGTAGQAFFTQTVNLAANTATVAVAVGDPTQTGGAARFQLLATPAARTQAATTLTTDFTVVNASPDGGPIGVRVRETAGVAADNLAYGTLAPGYTSVAAPGRYTLDVTRAGQAAAVGSYPADFSGTAGKAVTVLATGFSGTPPAGAESNRFGLLVVNTDGVATRLASAGGTPGLGSTVAAGAANFSVGVYTAAGATAVAPAGNTALGRTQERTAVADVNGDGLPDLITGSGPGVAGAVTVTLSAAPGGTGTTVSFNPFEATFTGGVFVTAADLNADGKADVVVTPDQGGGPVVAVYSGAGLAVVAGSPAAGNAAAAQLGRFLGIDDPAFRGGARAAAGDLSGDGRPDLIVAAGAGGGPRVAVFDGANLFAQAAVGGPPPKLLPDFFVFEPTLRNGVYVAAGDVSGDGRADLIAGGGPGGGPRVFALSGADLTAATSKQTAVGNFFAGDPNSRDGVRLAVKDLDGDPFADVVVGLGAAGGPQVRGFRGRDFAATVTTGATPAAIPALELTPFPGATTVYVG